MPNEICPPHFEIVGFEGIGATIFIGVVWDYFLLHGSVLI